MELEHGETYVDELNFDEARAQDDKKEPEQSETLRAVKDEKRAELAHGEFCVENKSAVIQKCARHFMSLLKH